MSQRVPNPQETTKLAKEFILLGDKTKAFRATFPNSKASDKTIWTKASQAFKLTEVQQRIEELQRISKKKSEEEFGMTTAELKKTLKLAMGIGLSQGKPSATVAAVREFNCMDGNHSPVKTDHSSSDGSMTPKRDFNDFYKEK